MFPFSQGVGGGEGMSLQCYLITKVNDTGEQSSNCPPGCAGRIRKVSSRVMGQDSDP